MSERPCADCRHYQATGKKWQVPVCLHPSVVNQHGCYATSLARRWDEKACGFDGKLWERK
jgi:hypothetical protein